MARITTAYDAATSGWRVVLPAALVLLAAGAARADDAPTIAKDSVRVKATFVDGAWTGGKKGPGSSWLPAIEYRVNGPIAKGTQLSAEFSLPGGKPWVKFDCPEVVLEVKTGAWWKTACGALTYDRSPGVRDNQAITATGVFGFAIKASNELAGMKATLFTGKVKVGKWTPHPKAPLAIEYYVDEDWRLPIGYVGFEHGAQTQSPGQRYEGNDSDVLVAAMEFRGKAGDVKGHLFYQGKEISDDWCSKGENAEVDPAKLTWAELECKFHGVYRGDPPAGGGEDPKHSLSKNPGDYEIKVLSAGKLARSLKFSVAPDGSFDKGTGAANKIGSGRAIVPVQLLGNQGPWDKTAWKSGAYYGNPLTGFTAAP
jgi:hypothetical protein